MPATDPTPSEGTMVPIPTVSIPDSVPESQNTKPSLLDDNGPHELEPLGIADFGSKYKLTKEMVDTSSETSIVVFSANDIDSDLIPKNWVFLTENEILAEEQKSTVTEQLCDCGLTETCSTDRCACAKKHTGRSSGAFFQSVSSEKRICIPHSGFILIPECAQSCPCDKATCSLTYFTSELRTHRKPQLGLLRVAKDSYPSWSVITLVSMEKGQFAMEVTGEVIDESAHQAEDDPFHPLVSKNPASLYLRMKAKGSLARFLSHNCDPNLSVVRVGQKDGRRNRILLFSNQEIGKDEELSVNFEQLMDMDFRLVCDCGGKACKGYIGEGDWGGSL